MTVDRSASTIQSILAATTIIVVIRSKPRPNCFPSSERSCKAGHSGRLLTLAHAAGMVGGDPCVCLGASEAATVDLSKFSAPAQTRLGPALFEKDRTARQIDFVNLFWPNGDQESAVNFQLVMECSLVARQTRDNVKVSYRLYGFLPAEHFPRRKTETGHRGLGVRKVIATQTEAMPHKGFSEKSRAKHIPAGFVLPGLQRFTTSMAGPQKSS